MEIQSDPIAFFRQLYEQHAAPGVPEASVMTLATASKQGKPSARIVLLKEFDEEGFVFYTNLESRKGRELRDNPYAALCFYWEAIHYQVRVQGKVRQVSDEEADAYFATRPRGSQIGAWASAQSSPLDSREELQRRFDEYQARFVGKSVPRPDFWSGFRLIPERMEFWQHRDNRLHDRILYERKGDHWDAMLLYP